MVRFLLRSPLLWIGMVVAAYLSLLWLKSTAKPIGFNYSGSGQRIGVAVGWERFSMVWDSGPGLGQGYVHGGPGVYEVMLNAGGETRDAVGFNIRSAPGRSHRGVSWSFPALLAGHLVVWYGFLGWRAWRYYRRERVAVAPVQAPAGG